MEYTRALRICVIHRSISNGMAADNAGNIYFATDKKLWKLSVDKTIEHVAVENIRQVVWDAYTNSLFVTKDNSIVHYHPQTKKFTTVHYFSGGRIATDNKGNLYVAERPTREIFLLRIVKEAEGKVHCDAKKIVGKNHLVDAMLVDDRGLYIGDDHGLKFLPKSAGSAHYIDFTPVPISDIVRQKDGILLISGAANCIGGFIGAVDPQINDRLSWALPLSVRKKIGMPWILQSDSEGNLYIATFWTPACWEIFKVTNTWPIEKVIWIAHLKEDPSYCCLAYLPKDLIRVVIAQVMIEPLVVIGKEHQLSDDSIRIFSDSNEYGCLSVPFQCLLYQPSFLHTV